MKNTLTVNDIMNDVDFELAQGVIANQDLRHGVEELRRFQSLTRKEAFEKVGLSDPNRELLSRQYQFNEMLLAMLHEMAVQQDLLRQDLHSMRSLPPPIASYSKPAAGLPVVRVSGDQPEARMNDEALRQAARQETIQVELSTHPVRIPLIGRLLARLRILYHKPAHFYTSQLATRQATVNQTFSNQILRLEALLRAQQAQIEALNASITGQAEEPEK